MIRIVSRDLKGCASSQELNPNLAAAGGDGNERDHLAIGRDRRPFVQTDVIGEPMELDRTPVGAWLPLGVGHGVTAGPDRYS